MTGVVAAVIVGLAALIVGLLVGYILRKSIGEKTIGNAEQKAKNLILDAENRAETLKKEKILEAKEEVHRQRNDAERGDQGEEERDTEVREETRSERRSDRQKT